MLLKLRANEDLSIADIRCIEAEIHTWLNEHHPECDHVTANNAILRFILVESQASLDLAYESLTNTAGDPHWRCKPLITASSGKVQRHYSNAKD